jgi:hypothetical protein
MQSLTKASCPAFVKGKLKRVLLLDDGRPEKLPQALASRLCGREGTRTQWPVAWYWLSMGALLHSSHRPGCGSISLNLTSSDGADGQASGSRLSRRHRGEALHMLKPFERMWARVENEKADSDTAFFFGLLNLGELVLKFIVAGVVAAIPDDKNRLKYRHEHSLVRADGVGDWASTLDEILTGPAAQIMLPEARPEQRALTERLGAESWQHRAVSKLHFALQQLDANISPLPEKLDGRRWFRLFAQIRNKTRGHGAQRAGLLSGLCKPIEDSLRFFTENFPLFSREWAYIHRNLSGKYRVSALSELVPHFDYLKKPNTEPLVDGIYVFLGSPAFVDLVQSNADLLDFYLPNGHFTDSQYEMLSYITGDRIQLPSQRFLIPPDLPASQTQGLGELDVQGECFTNLPPELSDYVNRPQLERAVLDLLLDDRHPIVTLGGSGGIGKTSLALCVLHRILSHDRFKAVVWFSSRDIDLFPEGAKPVKPRIMNEEDASDEFTRLLQVGKLDRKSRVEFFARCLTCAEFPPDLLKSNSSPESNRAWPLLFVFDNFETVVRPAEFFKWLDTHVRLPNKLLVTTRVRSFQGDYAVPVEGMDDDECRQLIARTRGPSH